MGNGLRKGWESRSPISARNMSSPEVVKQGFLVKKVSRKLNRLFYPVTVSVSQ